MIPHAIEPVEINTITTLLTADLRSAKVSSNRWSTLVRSVPY